MDKIDQLATPKAQGSVVLCNKTLFPVDSRPLDFFFTKIPQIVVFERKYLFKSIIWGIHVKIPLHMTNCYKIQTQDLNTFEYNHFPVSNEMCPTQQKNKSQQQKNNHLHTYSNTHHEYVFFSIHQGKQKSLLHLLGRCFFFVFFRWKKTHGCLYQVGHLRLGPLRLWITQRWRRRGSPRPAWRGWRSGDHPTGHGTGRAAESRGAKKQGSTLDVSENRGFSPKMDDL